MQTLKEVEDFFKRDAELQTMKDEVKRLRKVGKILAEEIVELTEELIKLRSEDRKEEK